MAVDGEGKRIVPVWERFTKKAIKKHEKLFHWNDKEEELCLIEMARERDKRYSNVSNTLSSEVKANNNKWTPQVGDKCWWDGISPYYNKRMNAQEVTIISISPTGIASNTNDGKTVLTTRFHLSKLNTCPTHLPRITVITLDKYGEKSEYSFRGEPDYARIRRETIDKGMKAAFVINKETKEAKNFLCDEIWLSSLTARRYTIPFDSVAREIVILQHEIKSHCVQGCPNPKFHINEHAFLSVGDVHKIIEIVSCEWSNAKKCWIYGFALQPSFIHWQPEKYFHKLRYQKDDGSWEEVNK